MIHFKIEVADQINREIAAFIRAHKPCTEGKFWLQTQESLADAWVNCAEPSWMIWALVHVNKINQSIVSWWVLWCMQQIWSLLKDERSRRVVEIAELYLSGKATFEELRAACADATAAYIAAYAVAIADANVTYAAAIADANLACAAAVSAAYACADANVHGVVFAVNAAAVSAACTYDDADVAVNAIIKQIKQKQAEKLRERMGANPFEKGVKENGRRKSACTD